MVKAQEDNDHWTRNTILNAIAALLVQNSKITAVVAYNLPNPKQTAG